MRIAAAAASVLLLVLLLTWMSLRAFNGEAEQFDGALAKIDRSSMLEARLQSDVLSARAGLLRNYDRLVKDTDALRGSVAALREMAGSDPTLVPVADALASAFGRQEQLVEQFKTDNALLRNSLSYFASFTARPDRDTGNGSASDAVSGLVAAMLRFTLDTSASSAQEVRDRLERLAAQQSGGAVDGLLAHGRLLQHLLPATDRVLADLFAASPIASRGTLRSSILVQQANSRAVARRYRTALYLTSLLLVVLLVYLGWQLRQRAQALRRRAAFERVIVASSLRFVVTPAEDLDGAIGRTLAEMARCVGADRAYLIASAPAPVEHTWCRPGISLPPGWPEKAPAFLDQFDCLVTGSTLHIPNTNRLSSPDRQALEAEGLRGWACTSRLDETGNRLLLGFDAVTHVCRITRSAELGLLPMALDVIANALERQELEGERQRLQARLQQSRQLETVGALASGITHNFNNILGAILGYAEMGSEWDAGDGRQRMLMREIRSAGHRARELVDQILTFARRGEPQKRPVQVRPLVDESVSLLRALLPASVELRVAEIPDAAVLGEPAQLQQVILNLGSNGAQATALQGRVDLSAETVELSRPRALSHGTVGPGAYVRIAVSDDGRGIDRATLERIFEPFFTTRSNGNGLGLATTREIVGEHGGAVHVQSTVGLGTRFDVWLPQLRSFVLLPSSGPKTLRGGGQTVLVIEQQPERLLRTEDIVAALGFEPVGFSSPAEAEAAYRARPDRFDAVLLGHVGAPERALRTAASLREAGPALPILLGAASSGGFGAGELADAGVSDVLRWPFAAPELLGALNDVLPHSDAGAAPQR